MHANRIAFASDEITEMGKILVWPLQPDRGTFLVYPRNCRLLPDAALDIARLPSHTPSAPHTADIEFPIWRKPDGLVGMSNCSKTKTASIALQLECSRQAGAIWPERKIRIGPLCVMLPRGQAIF